MEVIVNRHGFHNMYCNELCCCGNIFSRIDLGRITDTERCRKNMYTGIYNCYWRRAP